MLFSVVTIFPEFFVSPLQEGIVRRAQYEGHIRVAVHNLRDFAADRHQMTDDRPFGGGEGMVMKPEPLAAAVRQVQQDAGGGRVLLLSPRGVPLTQERVRELAQEQHLVLVCGRYEGVDERFCRLVDEEVSLGDFVVSGGELPALVLIDAVMRLLPGVLGCADSAERDSFSRGLLKHPQYTRPRVFEGEEVPPVLLSGDHSRIAAWRFLRSVEETLARRPDLLPGLCFSREELALLRQDQLWARLLTAGWREGSHAGH
ncbi:MAG: tRNA (guanosine(37)-N1)-methyltransferase TrmD [Desulfobulbaceae bacterium A2]|nr:MAG: tRNA (guanosine(37)-N1)-methyltransferase TrmD [Desulfobulbaceae bacterium A2]